MIDAADHYTKSKSESSRDLVRTLSGLDQVSRTRTDETSLEEFELFRGRILDDADYGISVPSIMYAPTYEEMREVRICNLAVNTSLRIFRKIDEDDSGEISLKELETIFGKARAREQLSVWDPSGDGSIERTEMVDVLLKMFHSRYSNLF